LCQKLLAVTKQVHYSLLTKYYRKYVSPFSKKAKSNNILKIGGKPDDITIIIAQVILIETDLNGHIKGTSNESSTANTSMNTEGEHRLDDEFEFNNNCNNSFGLPHSLSK